MEKPKLTTRNPSGWLLSLLKELQPRDAPDVLRCSQKWGYFYKLPTAFFPSSSPCPWVPWLIPTNLTMPACPMGVPTIITMSSFPQVSQPSSPCLDVP